MFTSIRECVVCNDLWLWPIFSRSFSHDFAIKLLKHVTSCRVCSTAHTVLNGFFPYLSQIIYTMRRCITCNHIWIWPISSKSFSHKYAIELLKYGIPCRVHSTISSGWITSLLGTNDHYHEKGVSHSMTFELDLYLQGHLLLLCLIHGLYLYTNMHRHAQIQPMRKWCVMYDFQVNRSKVKVTQVLWVFAVSAGGS